MGDAYRGLTIRIGADATPLQRVLGTINTASRKTATEVRKINSALKLDPGNVSLMEQKVRSLGDSGKSAAAKMAVLKQSLNQNIAKVGGWEKLNSVMEGVETRVEILRNKYNVLDQSLESVYDTIWKYNTAVKGMSEEKATEALRELMNNARRSGDEVRYLERELRSVWNTGKVRIPFDTHDVDVAIQKWKELRTQHSIVLAELESAKDAAGIKEMVLNEELFKNELKQANSELVEQNNRLRQLGNNQGAREAAQTIEMLGLSVKDAEADIKLMDQAMRAMPDDVSAAEGKMTALRQKAKLLTEQIEQLKVRMQSLDGSAIHEIESRFTTTANAVRVLSERERQARDEAEKLRAELALALDSGEGDAEKLAEQLRVVELKLKNISRDLDRANDAHAAKQAQAEFKSLNGELASTEAHMQRVRTSVGQVGMAVRTMGYSLMATVGAGALMVGMYATQATEEIDAAYRNMRKTVNGTEEQFQHLKDAALEFSQTHFTSADQILEIESVGGQLGIAAHNLEKFSEVVSNVDIATNLDTETISQNFGQLSNIMNDMDQDIKTGPGSLEAYGDALVRLGNNSAAQEDKIQNVMMRIASMGTISGMTTPDLLALATATAATGQGAEAAGTALAKTFSNIEGAVNGSQKALDELNSSTNLTDDEIESLTKEVEKGQDKLAAFAEVAGMSADDFKTAWNNAPMEAFKALIEGLKRIDQAGGSVDSTLQGLKITSVRQKQTLQGLTQTTDVLNNALQMSNDAWNGISDIWGDAGDAAREAQRKSEGFSGQLEILKNNGKVLAEEFMNSLTPVISQIGDIARGAVDVFSAWPDEIKTMTAAFGGLLGISGPVTIFIGSVMAGASSIKHFFKDSDSMWNKVAMSKGVFEKAGASIVTYGASMEKASTKSGKLGKAVQKMGTSIGSLSFGKLIGITAAIAGVAAVAGIVSSELDKWKERADLVSRASKTMGERASDAMSSAVKRAGDLSRAYVDVQKAISSHEDYMKKLADSNDTLAKSATEAFTKIESIGKYADDAAPLIEKLADGETLSSAEFMTLSGAIAGFTEATGENISVVKGIDGSVRVLKDGVDLAADAFRNLADAQIETAHKSYWSAELKSQTEAMLQGKRDLQAVNASYAEVIRKKQDLDKEYLQGQIDATGYKSLMDKYAGQEKDLKRDIDETTAAIQRAEDGMKAASGITSLFNDELRNQEGTFQNLIAANDDAVIAFSTVGRNVYDFIKALNEAGVSVEQLKGSQLDQVILDWDGTIPGLLKSLELFGATLTEEQDKVKKLDGLPVKDKVYKVDSGQSIYDEEGNLERLQQITIDNKHYYVTDDGSVYDEEAKLTDIQQVTLENKHFYVTDDGSVRTELGELSEFERVQLNGFTYYVKNDGTIYDEKGELKTLDEIQIQPKEFTVDADDSSAWAKLSNLDNFQFSPKTVPVNVQATGFDASGGSYPHGKIAAHASGYFVDRPTVIGRTGNVTHIAGEAGREYVQKFANGGFGVMPLTNPKMRPWTTDIARQLSQMGGGGNTFYITLDYKAGDDANRMARELMREISNQIGR